MCVDMFTYVCLRRRRMWKDAKAGVTDYIMDVLSVQVRISFAFLYHCIVLLVKTSLYDVYNLKNIKCWQIGSNGKAPA